MKSKGSCVTLYASIPAMRNQTQWKCHNSTGHNRFTIQMYFPAILIRNYINAIETIFHQWPTMKYKTIHYRATFYNVQSQYRIISKSIQMKKIETRKQDTYIAMALSVYFRAMSLTVPLVSFAPLLDRITWIWWVKSQRISLPIRESDYTTYVVSHYQSYLITLHKQSMRNMHNSSKL